MYLRYLFILFPVAVLAWQVWGLGIGAKGEREWEEWEGEGESNGGEKGCNMISPRLSLSTSPLTLLPYSLFLISTSFFIPFFPSWTLFLPYFILSFLFAFPYFLFTRFTYSSISSFFFSLPFHFHPSFLCIHLHLALFLSPSIFYTLYLNNLFTFRYFTSHWFTFSYLLFTLSFNFFIQSILIF